MIVPVEWLKEYVKTKKSAGEIAETFTRLGLMLDKPIMKSKFGNAVLDLEHRMDRADWLSILGCARDFAAMEDSDLKAPKSFSKEGEIPNRVNIVPIVVECPDLVTRFNTRVIKNVEVGKSPKWLEQRLIEYGIPSINNIVDITNYVMVEYGQPLHAQDLANFDKREILIRRAREGETLETLDGTVIDLTPEMFILTQNGQPIALGGIVGGKATSVTGKTTEIILDAGNYNQANIRQTSRKLGIRNETVLRSEKYLHPRLTETALERAVELILELAGGEYYENVDWYPTPAEPRQMELRYTRIKKLSGEEADPKRVKEILQRLEYEIIEETNNRLDLQIPYFRTDVQVEDDIVSDILRLQNYENIESIMPRQAPPREITDPKHKIKERVRDILAKAGGVEYITNPLVAGDPEDTNQVHLENALSEEQNALRTSITETLGQVATEYKKQNKAGFIFEIGRVYFIKDQQYREKRKICAIQIDENQKEASIELRKNLATLLTEMEIRDFYYAQKNDEMGIYQGERRLGILQENSFTLDIQELLFAQKETRKLIKAHMNKSTIDISLVAGKDTNMGKYIYQIKTIDPRIGEIDVIEEYTGENIEEGKRAVLVEVLIRAKELTSKDINEVQDKIVKSLESSGEINVRK